MAEVTVTLRVTNADGLLHLYDAEENMEHIERALKAAGIDCDNGTVWIGSVDAGGLGTAYPIAYEPGANWDEEE